MDQSNVINNRILKIIVKLFTKFPFLFTVFIGWNVCLICVVLHNASMNHYVSCQIQWDGEGRIFLEDWYGECCTAITEPNVNGHVFPLCLTFDNEVNHKYVYILDQESEDILGKYFGNSCNVSIADGRVTLLDRVRFYHLTGEGLG
jgi:hypothetical protein